MTSKVKERTVVNRAGEVMGGIPVLGSLNLDTVKRSLGSSSSPSSDFAFEFRFIINASLPLCFNGTHKKNVKETNRNASLGNGNEYCIRSSRFVICSNNFLTSRLCTSPHIHKMQYMRDCETLLRAM